MVRVTVHAVLTTDHACQCSAAAKLAKKLNVDCPIIDGIFRVIHEKAEPLGVSTLLVLEHCLCLLAETSSVGLFCPPLPCRPPPSHPVAAPKCK